MLFRMKHAHYFAPLFVAVFSLCTAEVALARLDSVSQPAVASPQETFTGAATEEETPSVAISNVDLGHASKDPYKAMVEDIVATPTSDRSTVSGQLAAKKGHSLFYDEDEVKARMDSVKSTFSSLFGDDEPQATSDEERELGLQKDIAMRGAYKGTTLAGGSTFGGASSSARTQQNDAEKVRLAELAFLIWDILTHPLTLAVVVFYGLGRLTIAIFRVARNPRGDKRKGRRSSSRRTRDRPLEPAMAQAAQAHEQEREPTRERRHRHRRHASRRRRSQRSFLDYFRSV